MERIPILRMGDLLLVTIQVDMHDRLAMTLQDDLTERIVRVIRELDMEVATPAEARQLMGLPRVGTPRPEFALG